MGAFGHKFLTDERSITFTFSSIRIYQDINVSKCHSWVPK